MGSQRHDEYDAIVLCTHTLVDSTSKVGLVMSSTISLASTFGGWLRWRKRVISGVRNTAGKANNAAAIDPSRHTHTTRK
eukprot:COSAG06_NODE_179_length_20947_cov_53.746882_6_plen_79_part_00